MAYMIASPSEKLDDVRADIKAHLCVTLFAGESFFGDQLLPVMYTPPMNYVQWLTP